MDEEGYSVDDFDGSDGENDSVSGSSFDLIVDGPSDTDRIMNDASTNLEDCYPLKRVNLSLPFADRLYEERNQLKEDIFRLLSSAHKRMEENGSVDIEECTKICYHVDFFFRLGYRLQPGDRISLIQYLLKALSAENLIARTCCLIAQTVGTLVQQSLFKIPHFRTSWKPIFQLLKKRFWLPSRARDLISRPEVLQLGRLIISMLGSLRMFFEESDADEVFDEFRPLFCPVDLDNSLGICYLCSFLPVRLSSPYRILDELMELWIWEASDWFWDANILSVLDRIAQLSPVAGSIDWSPYASVIGTKIYGVLDLNIGKYDHSFEPKAVHDGCAIFFNSPGEALDLSVRLAGSFLCSILSPSDSTAWDLLKKILASIEIFYHPSQHVAVGNLLGFMDSLCVSFSDRLSRESEGKVFYDSSFFLKREHMDRFTDMLLPLLLKAMYSEIPSMRSIAQLGFKYLSFISPGKVFPALMNNVQGAFESVEEANRAPDAYAALAITMRMFLSFEGAAQRVLQVVPFIPTSISPSEPVKSSASTSFLAAFVLSVPLIPYDLHHPDFVSLDQNEREALTVFSEMMSEWSIQVFDQILNFALNFTVANEEENTLSHTLQLCIRMLLIHTPPDISGKMVDRAFDVLTSTIDIKLLATMCTLLSIMAFARPEIVVSRWIHYARKTLTVSVDEPGQHSTTYTKRSDLTDLEIRWILAMTSSISNSSAPYFVPFLDDLIVVTDIGLDCDDDKVVFEALCTIEGILSGLTSIRAMDVRCVPASVWETDDFQRCGWKYWAKHYHYDDCGHEYIKPGKEQIYAAHKFVRYYCEKGTGIVRTVIRDYANDRLSQDEALTSISSQSASETDLELLDHDLSLKMSLTSESDDLSSDLASDMSMKSISLPSLDSLEEISEHSHNGRGSSSEDSKSNTRISRHRVIPALRILLFSLRGASFALPEIELTSENVPLCGWSTTTYYPSVYIGRDDLFEFETDDMKDYICSLRQRMCTLCVELFESLAIPFQDYAFFWERILSLCFVLFNERGLSTDDASATINRSASVSSTLYDGFHDRKTFLRFHAVLGIEAQYSLRTLAAKPRLFSFTRDLEMIWDLCIQLGMHEYLVVRGYAQRNLVGMSEYLDKPVFKCTLPRILEVLSSSKSAKHERKGSIYLLGSLTIMLETLVEDWNLVMYFYLSIMNTLDIDRESTREAILQLVQMLFPFQEMTLQTIANDCFDGGRSCSAEEERSASMRYHAFVSFLLDLVEEFPSNRSPETYIEAMGCTFPGMKKMIERLISMVQSKHPLTKQWQFELLTLAGLCGIAMLGRPNIHPTTRMVLYFIRTLSSDVITIRAVAGSVINAVLSMFKEHSPQVILHRIPSSVSGRTSLQLQRDAFSSFPKDKQDWEKCLFLDKNSFGFYAFPSSYKAYSYSIESLQALEGFLDNPENLNLRQRNDTCKVLGKSLLDMFESNSVPVSPSSALLSSESALQDFSSFSSLHERAQISDQNGRTCLESLLDIMQVDLGPPGANIQYDSGNSQFWKGLAKICGPSFWHMLLPYLKEMSSVAGGSALDESNKLCVFAEIIAGLARGSSHWSFGEQKEMWDSFSPILRYAAFECSTRCVHHFIRCFRDCVYDRDPRRIQWILDISLHEFDLSDHSKPVVYHSRRLAYIEMILSELSWRLPSYSYKVLELIEPFIGHPFKHIRIYISKLLSFLCISQWYPAVSRETGFCSFQLSGDHEDVRISEFLDRWSELLAGIDLEQCLTIVSSFQQSPPTCEEDMIAFEQSIIAINSVSTVLEMLYQVSVTHRPRVTLPIMLRFLPIVLKSRGLPDEEMKMVSQSIYVHFSYTLLIGASQAPLPDLVFEGNYRSSSMVEGVIQFVFSVLEDTVQYRWQNRLAVLEMLQPLIFRNRFMLNDSLWNQLFERLIDTLADSSIEVRDMASITLSGFVPVLEAEEKLDSILDRFRSLSRTPLPKKGRKFDLSDPTLNAKVSLRQSGILGLASIIRAYPHEIKSFTPEILCIVAGHINDPSPIPLAVRRVLSDFWKTHRDMWTVHKLEFTESQLDELSELMLAPYYYC